MARQKLSRPEQRFNYVLAASAVAVIVILVIASPRVVFQGSEVPVLVVVVLAAAFLFGLGQMIVGLSRRRRYMKSLPEGDSSAAEE